MVIHIKILLFSTLSIRVGKIATGVELQFIDFRRFGIDITAPLQRPVVVNIHFLIIDKKIGIAKVIRRVIPGGIHVVPLAVHVHHIPGVCLGIGGGYLAMRIATVYLQHVQQQLASRRISGADPLTLQNQLRSIVIRLGIGGIFYDTIVNLLYLKEVRHILPDIF